MENKINTSANTSVSMKYGRKDAIHDKERNINLRGMGSVGTMSENFGSGVPTVLKHNIPTLHSKGLDVKQAAALEMGSRYAQY
jgi:hypothetical protein